MRVQAHWFTENEKRKCEYFTFTNGGKKLYCVSKCIHKGKALTTYLLSDTQHFFENQEENKKIFNQAKSNWEMKK